MIVSEYWRSLQRFPCSETTRVVRLPVCIVWLSPNAPAAVATVTSSSCSSGPRNFIFFLSNIKYVPLSLSQLAWRNKSPHDLCSGDLPPHRDDKSFSRKMFVRCGDITLTVWQGCLSTTHCCKCSRKIMVPQWMGRVHLSDPEQRQEQAFVKDESLFLTYLSFSRNHIKMREHTCLRTFQWYSNLFKVGWVPSFNGVPIHLTVPEIHSSKSSVFWKKKCAFWLHCTADCSPHPMLSEKHFSHDCGPQCSLTFSFLIPRESLFL